MAFSGWRFEAEDVSCFVGELGRGRVGGNEFEVAVVGEVYCSFLAVLVYLVPFYSDSSVLTNLLARHNVTGSGSYCPFASQLVNQRSYMLLLSAFHEMRMSSPWV